MPYGERWRWLRQATGKETIRAIATQSGVSHTTVQRWLKNGIPAGALWELIVRFRTDPIEALVVWGFLEDARVAGINYEALVKYAPLEVLTAELNRRALEYRKKNPDPTRKVGVGEIPAEEVGA